MSKTEKASMLMRNVDSLLSGESSVELTSTTRGTTWKVKVYNTDPLEALESASLIYEKCKERYGGDTVEGK